MEDTSVLGLWQTASVIKRKRTSVRRPQKISMLLFGCCDSFPLSYTPSPDELKNISPDDNLCFDGSLQSKEFYICDPLLKSISLNEASKKRKEERFYATPNSRDQELHTRDMPSGECRTYSHRLDEPSSMGAESKLKKLKFKVGGVTRTIHATPNVKAANLVSSSLKFTYQDNCDYDQSPSGKERFSYGDEPEDACGANSSMRKFTEAKLSGKKLDHVYFSRATKDNRKRFKSDDTGYIEEKEPGSDDGHGEQKRKQKTLLIDSPPDVRLEPLTKRQRSLQSCKDGNGSSLIEFPDGLPPAPSRRKKQKLTEVEEQAKKAEVAQRRKMQVEKAARELETAAIRKILGLDADKKKAEKEKAQADKVAKAANYQKLEENTVRWTYGPNGTVVTFPENVDLPSILHSTPCSYPPPREKCAGPSCTNPYKYRDSKSNLPLCSLQCYRAMQGSVCPVQTC